MSHITNMKQIKFDHIYRGDARIFASKLPNGSISVTVTSPPYWNLKDYGVENQIGWGQEYSQYLDDIISIFHQIYRATKDSGSLWVVLDTFKTNGNVKLLPFEFADRLQREIGWILQDIIIWDKVKTLPWSRTGQLRNQFEYILCFSKRKNFKYEIDRIKEITLKEWWVKYPERYNPKGKVPSNIWMLPIPVQGSWSKNGLCHACPFPTYLVERILSLTTDPQKSNIVFDPFAGSGVVLAVAEQMGRGYLGFELNPEFIEMYRTRVRSFVKEEFLYRTAHQKTLEDNREALENQILKLRLTKYPKMLFKILHKSLLQETQETPVFCGILALSANLSIVITTPTEKHHVASLKIFLFAESIKNRTLLEEKILQIKSKPPLSKFGINAQIIVITLQELQALQPHFGIPDNEPLWVYKRGKTHIFSGQTTLKKWLKDIQIKRYTTKAKIAFPTIVSNIAVSQKIERTWYLKNAEKAEN